MKKTSRRNSGQQKSGRRDGAPTHQEMVDTLELLAFACGYTLRRVRERHDNPYEVYMRPALPGHGRGRLELRDRDLGFVLRMPQELPRPKTTSGTGPRGRGADHEN